MSNRIGLKKNCKLIRKLTINCLEKFVCDSEPEASEDLIKNQYDPFLNIFNLNLSSQVEVMEGSPTFNDAEHLHSVQGDHRESSQDLQDESLQRSLHLDIEQEGLTSEMPGEFPTASHRKCETTSHT